MPNLKPQRWISPITPGNIINAMVDVERLTEEDIKRDPRLVKTREGWIASMYLLFRTLIDDKPWYLRKNETEDSVDDIYGACFYKKDGATYSDGELPIQTFVVNEYSGSLIDSIKKKFKHDLRGVVLVCYVMRDESIMWQELMDELSKVRVPASEIVVIGNLGVGTFQVTRISPNFIYKKVHPSNFVWNYPKAVEGQRVLHPEETGTSYIGKTLITPNISVLDEK